MEKKAPKRPRLAPPGWASQWPELVAAKKGAGSDGLNRNEYDFSAVPESELCSCAHYEYSREYRGFTEQVESMRQQIAERIAQEANGTVAHDAPFRYRHTKFTQKGIGGHDLAYLVVLLHRKEFPRIAWGDLTRDAQSTLLQNLPGRAHRSQEETMLENFPPFVGDDMSDANFAIPTLAKWKKVVLPEAYQDIEQKKNGNWIRSGFFAVHLGYPPETLIEGFKQWLEAQTLPQPLPKVEKRGRKSYRDRLNALGAMRLRYYCRSLSEAQRLVATPGQAGGLFYSDRTAWNRACDRAVKYFREILDLAGEELPIHYSKGWQK